MIDLHCHILPGADDGPGTLDEAVEMCRIAERDGIGTIVATPHFRPGIYEIPDIAGRIDELRGALAEKGIRLTILPGSDVTVTPELPGHLAAKPGLTINNTGKYFLAELPHEAVPARWEEFLLDILRNGITPILTHPERNHWFIHHPDALLSFVHAGGLVQITASSILGESGVESRNYCIYLLKRNLVHVVATDAHSRLQRPPLLSPALRTAASLVGSDRAMRLVRDIPEKIISGLPMDAPGIEPGGMKKRRWYQRMLDL